MNYVKTSFANEAKYLGITREAKLQVTFRKENPQSKTFIDDKTQNLWKILGYVTKTNILAVGCM